MWDILLTNGHVVDPANKRNGIMDVAIENGKIAAVGTNLCGKTKAVEDCSNRYVFPGIIDAHMHLGSVYGSPYGARMTALSGITTCLDMAGPLSEVLQDGHKTGAGLNVAVLDRMEPSELWGTDTPTRAQIASYIDKQTQAGAIGIKLVGGHWPLSVQACRDTIELCNEKDVYVAWHAGSTTAHSDINGMKEAVEVTGNMRLHLAHINSYCRGRVYNPEVEASEALELLKAHPRIWSEAYLSPLNGTHLSCDEKGQVLDHVTKNCLESFSLPVSYEGIQMAFKSGILKTLKDTGYITEILEGDEGMQHWIEKGTTNVVGCLPVNSAISRLMLASSKRDDGSFVVDAMSTDGGCIPRNVIIPMGLALVDFGAISLSEFVLKASLNAARHLRLFDRGHLSDGATADITIVDKQSNLAVETFIDGKVNMKNGVLYGNDTRFITTETGAGALKDLGYQTIVIDLAQDEPQRIKA